MWEKLLRDKLKPARGANDQVPPDKSAAVLVLYVLSSGGGWGHLLLTKRTSTLETHKGQMSFPGGYPEKEDRDWLETALRETKEEIGIESHQVEIIGCLEPVLTKGSITILPYVGILKAELNLVLNPAEVEKTVFLPVEILMHQGLKQIQVREGPYLIQSIGLEWEGELIWGATAKMLEQIYQIFSKLPKPTS